MEPARRVFTSHVGRSSERGNIHGISKRGAQQMLPVGTVSSNILINEIEPAT